MSNGQRYSVMVKLDQMQGSYTLRFASYPYGSDMQQVIEGQATIVYQVWPLPFFDAIRESNCSRATLEWACP